VAETTGVKSGHRATLHSQDVKPHPTARVPLAGPRSTVAGAPASGTTQPAAPHAHNSAGSHHGIDLGWLAACIGLITVATVLGHPDAARRTAARGRSRLDALLRLSRASARQ
jgi:hypothetical protein